MAWSDEAKKRAIYAFETLLVDDGPLREQMQSRLLAALDAAAAVDGDAQWNAACDAAATVADRLVGEWHSDLADGCAREAATAIRSLKRLK